MDDILIAHKERSMLQTILQDLIWQLQSYGLIVAPEKIQIQPLLIIWEEFLIHKLFLIRLCN